MLKWIAQNKYKLMAFIIGLYLVVDVLQHKGQARVLFPKDFTEVKKEALLPQSKSILVNKDKNWMKAVNSKEQMLELNVDDAGFECDVYFDTAAGTFYVHHDPDKNTGYSLDNLLQLYQQNKLQAGIWLDIKNLGDLNAALVVQSLTELRNKYKLRNKILVESGRADLLTAFSDSSFFTSYYVPFFNPYTISKDALNSMADSMASVIGRVKDQCLVGLLFSMQFSEALLSWIPGFNLDR